MSLINTASLEKRAKFTEGFNSFENRKQKNGILATALDSNDDAGGIMTPDVKALMGVDAGIDKKIIAINKNEPTVGDTRTCTITGENNTSVLVSLTKNTVTTDIELYPAQYGSNDVKMREDLGQLVYNAENALAQDVEATLFTDLSASKNATYNSNLVGAGRKYELVANEMIVTEDEQPTFFYKVPSIMFADNVDVSNGAYVIGSASMLGIANEWMYQGSGNNTNLIPQFGGMDFRASNAYAVTGSNIASGMVIPKGMMGILFQNNSEFTMVGGLETNDAKWYTMALPQNLLGTEVGVLEKSFCADGSVATGKDNLTATAKIQYQLSIDYYTVTAYSSVADESPYYGFSFAGA